MLPTKDKIDILKCKSMGKLFYQGNKRDDLLDDSYQHLYICSSDEIKIGDYVFTQDTESRVEKVSDNLDFHKTFKSKKIIATTDKSLNLPEIPEQFLKEFCEKGSIWEVEVEYKEIHTKAHTIAELAAHRRSDDGEDFDKVYDEVFKENNGVKTYIPKLTNNTINIKPIKQTWKREEFELLLWNIYSTSQASNSFDFNTWLKQNIK